ncbi:MAG: rod shape-determining protein MreC [Clostridiales bacterium]|nr:rod shape-determining protein MreC [Clostridiales bacterium]
MKLSSRVKRRNIRIAIISGSLVLISAFLLFGSYMGFLDLSFLDFIPRYTIVPAKKAIDAVGEFFSDMFVDTTDLEADIISLQRELELKDLDTNEMEELRKENERLRQLLDFSAKDKLNYVGASVVAMTPGNWFSSFTIDAGANDGLKENMPVVTSDGLVGFLSEVSPNTSIVQSIVDSRSSLAGMVSRTRAHGVVNGTLYVRDNNNLMDMTYLVDDTSLAIGDVILTSGLEGIYPKGLVIGTVSEISRQTQDNIGSIIITPSVDFRRIEEVLVVVSEITEEE